MLTPRAQEVLCCNLAVYTKDMPSNQDDNHEHNSCLRNMMLNLPAAVRESATLTATMQLRPAPIKHNSDPGAANPAHCPKLGCHRPTPQEQRGQIMLRNVLQIPSGTTGTITIGAPENTTEILRCVSLLSASLLQQHLYRTACLQHPVAAGQPPQLQALHV